MDRERWKDRTTDRLDAWTNRETDALPPVVCTFQRFVFFSLNLTFEIFEDNRFLAFWLRSSVVSVLIPLKYLKITP